MLATLAEPCDLPPLAESQQVQLRPLYPDLLGLRGKTATVLGTWGDRGGHEDDPAVDLLVWRTGARLSLRGLADAVYVSVGGLCLLVLEGEIES